jgi:hypothetical protein
MGSKYNTETLHSLEGESLLTLMSPAQRGITVQYSHTTVACKPYIMQKWNVANCIEFELEFRRQQRLLQLNSPCI